MACAVGILWVLARSSEWFGGRQEGGKRVGGDGGKGGKTFRENGADLEARCVQPAITHNQEENKESVFSKKPGGRVFFLDLLHFFCEFLMNFFPDFAPNSRK